MAKRTHKLSNPWKGASQSVFELLEFYASLNWIRKFKRWNGAIQLSEAWIQMWL